MREQGARSYIAATMPLSTVLLIAVLVFAAAMLYSSVGHAGASGYLAVMALFGVAPEVMRPGALALNLLVASIASVKFYRAGRFSWRILWPFALTSVPAAFVGGRIVLPTDGYRVVVGAVLLFAALRMLTRVSTEEAADLRPPPIPAALLLGLAIGLLSGLTGVGGGIFLSPLLLLLHWADFRRAAGVAAVFILVNSAAGLAGYLSGGFGLPDGLPYWAVAVVAGGWIGAEYGSRRLAVPVLRRLLSLVLLIAGLKLIFA